MASLRERPRSDGTTAYAVKYRFGGRGSRQGSITFDNKKAALAFIAAVEAHGAKRTCEMYGINPEPQAKRRELTVATWVARHIDHLTGVEQATLDKYRSYLKRDITPAFGRLPLTDLSKDHLADWIKHMQTHGGRAGTGHAPKTLANKFGFLSGALNAAVTARKIPHNPANGIRLPRGTADDDHEMRMLTRDEYRALHDAIDDHYKLLVEFLVATGCRWGEASALQPKHVDLAAGTVKIRQAWEYSSRGYQLKLPKTRRSRRTVQVPKRILEQMDLTGEWVFARPDGKPIRYQGFWKDAWNPAVTAAELDPRPTPHDLRHTYASWHLNGGTPITIVSRQLGHENISVTVDVYGDLDQDSSRSAADFMDQLLS